MRGQFAPGAVVGGEEAVEVGVGVGHYRGVVGSRRLVEWQDGE